MNRWQRSNQSLTTGPENAWATKHHLRSLLLFVHFHIECGKYTEQITIKKGGARMFTDWFKKMIGISTVFALFFMFKVFTMLKSNFLSIINLLVEKKMMHTFRAIAITLAAMIAVLPLAATTPAWAQGSNTTSPAPTPATTARVLTSLPQLSAVGQGGGAQQYTDAINAQNLGALISNDVGLASNALGLVSSGA